MAVLKGAFVNFGAGLLGVLPNIVVFQFNPERMTRTPRMVQPPAQKPGEGKTNAQQVPAEPSESLSFTLRIDATDALAQGNPLAAASGVLPTISALELLMVPKSSLTIDLAALAGSSSTSKTPPLSLPMVLFVWGPYRIVPVTITTLSIIETAYDQLLNPIRAEINVALQILTPSQLAGQTLAIGAYTYSQGVKEAMAALNLANAVSIGVSASLSF
ncbi:MAG: hypothetical protein QOJ39_3246 [Candidatus Eremiobacteraeota bacterium]|jgi:hypothetical protein|nr:hypothetical protein [Candidatus Eremiobacteraeota bacterium]